VSGTSVRAGAASAPSYILAAVDLGADLNAIRTSAVMNGKLVAATEQEIEAAIATVSAALTHPILRRAAGNSTKSGLPRETPVLLRRENGSLVEGVVDLAFREDTSDLAGWTIVDFKTDREFETVSARYIAQIGLYLEAVESATGSPVRGVLLVL
jgi:ATP-dependent exoDNAse (exonuclease V) beta subunit